MKKKVHSESEKVEAVHQLESGVDAVVVAREYNISRATLYNWKSKYSGMEISQVKRLKELEDENCLFHSKSIPVFQSKSIPI